MIDSVGQSGGAGDEINYRRLHSQGGMGSSSRVVPGAGLEPARPQWPGDFKSPVSTNFTTRAGEKRRGRAGYHANQQSKAPNHSSSSLIFPTRARPFFGNIAIKES